VEWTVLYTKDELAESVGGCLTLALFVYLLAGALWVWVLVALWFLTGLSARLFYQRHLRRLPRQEAIAQALKEINDSLLESPD
jgi:Flp pilus assembly protein TadB